MDGSGLGWDGAGAPNVVASQVDVLPAERRQIREQGFVEEALLAECFLECSPRLKPGDSQFNPNCFQLRKSYVGSLGSYTPGVPAVRYQF